MSVNGAFHLHSLITVARRLDLSWTLDGKLLLSRDDSLCQMNLSVRGCRQRSLKINSRDFFFVLGAVPPSP